MSPVILSIISSSRKLIWDVQGKAIKAILKFVIYVLTQQETLLNWQIQSKISTKRYWVSELSTILKYTYSSGNLSLQIIALITVCMKDHLSLVSSSASFIVVDKVLSVTYTRWIVDIIHTQCCRESLRGTSLCCGRAVRHLILLLKGPFKGRPIPFCRSFT